MSKTISAEERLELVQTAKLLEPLKRASRRGRVNGLGYAIFGGLSVLLSMSSSPDWIGLIIGAVLIATGVTEFSQAARLGQGDPNASLRMAQAELALLGAVVFYCVLKITVLPSASEALRAEAGGDLSGLGLDIGGLIDSLTSLFYSVVMAVSILYQGGMARYFLRRRADVALYLAAPEWARSLAQSMNQMR